MKVSEVQFQFSSLTTQTEDAVKHWLQSASAVSVVTLEIFDQKGLVGITCIGINEADELFVPRGCPDPRDLYTILDRSVRLPDDIKFPKIA